MKTIAEFVKPWKCMPNKLSMTINRETGRKPVLKIFNENYKRRGAEEKRSEPERKEAAQKRR